MTEQQEETRRITIELNGKRPTVEFEGRITRRDINRLPRLLQVEYAKTERRRNLARRQAERKAVLKKEQSSG